MREQASDFNPTPIYSTLQKRAMGTRRPFSCTIELTYRCNFDCQMCYIRMTDKQAKPYGRMRSVEEWLDMARQMKEAGVLYLSLTGGECTLYPGFAELYIELCKMGFLVDIRTNASAFSSEVKSAFEAYPPLGVSITFYGSSNETYATVTGDPNGFDKVIENIHFFSKLGIPISYTYTICRQNVLDGEKIINLVKKWNRPFAMSLHLVPPHSGITDRFLKSALSPAERACIACHPEDEWALALENARELEKEAACFQPPVPGKELDYTKGIKDNSCVGSICSCAFSWNGNMSYCIATLGHRPVDPFEIGFEAAWRQLQAQLPEVFAFPPACRCCDMIEDCKYYCAGRNAQVTGDPQKPDPEICKYVYLLRKYREKTGRRKELIEASGCS